VTTSHPHVCFVAPDAWPVLSGDRAITSVGGAEVQQALVARSLVKRGYTISMVCSDYGQRDEAIVDGIKVYKTRVTAGGIPIVRWFHPRLTSMWSTLSRVDADVYYQRSAAGLTGLVGLFAKRRGKRFVYAAAHDLDLARGETWRAFNRRAGWRDRRLYTLGLGLADVIVAQHNRQQAACLHSYGYSSVVVPSCYHPSSQAQADPRGVVLWVSTLRAWKRPELFVALARECSNLKFRMVGGPSHESGGKELFERIRRDAEALPNFTFCGFVPFKDIDAHFNAARVFVNTSHWEGFPNTFLQSWSRGVPTVSFCDTGSRLDGRPIGFAVQDLNSMTQQVKLLMSDDDRWVSEGQHARTYVERHHSIASATEAYDQIFSRLAGKTLTKNVLTEDAARAS
jgi:glycosyltransferase involved in cell wall biosynthesis